MSGLEFEKPIIELEARINDLKKTGKSKKIDIEPDIKKIEQKIEKMKEEIYSNLTDWQRVQIARHPNRPYTLDYIQLMTSEFIEIHGDRLFADDMALVAGFAKLNGQMIVILGHQKGRDTKDNIRRNFGCAHPEGYRKAMRVMKLAEKFRLPVVALIDTPGAYPGVGAEERGQAQAIAENLMDMAGLKTPVIAVVIGEGGSGGALGVGVADRVLMLQNAYYSVISPEGCASILWRSSTKAADAANALKLTGEHLLKFGIIDEVVPEPQGGAHRDPEVMAATLKKFILKNIKDLMGLSCDELLEKRYEKFRRIGLVAEAGA